MSPQQSENKCWKQQVKANLCLCVTWKHIRGIEVHLHSFVPSALNWCSSTFSASRSHRLAPGKKPRYPLNKGLDGTQHLSRRFEKRKSVASCQESNPPIFQPIASAQKYNNNNNDNNNNNNNNNNTTNFPLPIKSTTFTKYLLEYLRSAGPAWFTMEFWGDLPIHRSRRRVQNSHRCSACDLKPWLRV